MSSLLRGMKYRLRTLIGVLTVSALALGWTVDRMHRRVVAVGLVRNAGGKLTSEYELRVFLRHSRTLAGLPAESGVERLCSERLLGGRQQSLSLTERTLPTGVVAAIASLHELRSLDLRGTNLSDDDLRALCGLRRLESLCLSGCPITDRSAQTLAGFTNLQWLELEDTQLSDAAVGHLTRLKNLQVLRIGGTLLTDRGISELCGLKNLQELACGGSDRNPSTPVTTAASAEINRRLPDCRTAGFFRSQSAE